MIKIEKTSEVKAHAVMSCEKLKDGEKGSGFTLHILFLKSKSGPGLTLHILFSRQRHGEKFEGCPYFISILLV